MRFLDALLGQGGEGALELILEAAERAAKAHASAILASEDGALRVVAARGLPHAPGQKVEDAQLREGPQSGGAVRYETAGPFAEIFWARARKGAGGPRVAALALPAHGAQGATGWLVLFAESAAALDKLSKEDRGVLSMLLSAALTRRGTESGDASRRPKPSTSGTVGGAQSGPSSGTATQGAHSSPAGGTTPRSARTGTLAAMLGESPAMRKLEREIRVLARTPTTTLVLGETGTGKELVARALHELSPRADRPLVIVNCGALPVHLVEAELFGHTKGAFTGAAAARAGKIEAAHGGTLFLDEIGELPLVAQAQLLRMLQEGEVQRVGDDRVHRVDVRVIAATHRDLRRAAAEGRFREDLLHRLWVYPVHVPPLRDRGEDVLVLARSFAARFAAEIGVGSPEMEPAAEAALRAHGWPGNVRELRHAVERAILHRIAASSESTASLGVRGGVRPLGGKLVLSVEDFDLAGTGDAGNLAPSQPRSDRATSGLNTPSSPAETPASDRAADALNTLHAPIETLDATIERVRREAFERAFRESGGNAAEAARRLGLSRSFAYKEAVRLGLLERPRGR